MTTPLSRAGLAAAMSCVFATGLAAPAHASSRGWDAKSEQTVRTFPSILPATPTGRGYHGARCGIAEAPPTAIRSLGCRDRDDVLFQAIAFPNGPAVQDFLKSRALGPDNRATIEDGTSATVRVGTCPDAACFVVTFDAQDRSKYLFIVAQTDTTISDLLKVWWPDADFTTGRGA
ncbi:MAG: hypothetical protein LLG14_04380 [Nocardiaceae bacterium]|nr:hypothetical protein [Nocardiaceae bacterium]